MTSRKPLTDEEGEVRELTKEDFAQRIPFSALPTELQELLSSPRQIKPDQKSPSTHNPAA